MSFKKATELFLATHMFVLLTILIFFDVKELRTVIVGFISLLLLNISYVGFNKYKETYVYRFKLKVAIIKEPSFFWLFLVGIALAIYSDSEEKMLLAANLSFAMVHLKYIAMHSQLKKKLKELQN